MPHKHRLKGTDASSHELPPTSIALPLPVSKTSKPQATHKPPKRKNDPKDDTPRAFTRLMNYTSTGKKIPRGLDDGIKPSASKKRKRDADDQEQAAQDVAHPSHDTKAEIPRILPGERMADYSARVDQALPVVGLASKGRGKGVTGLRERQTKTERKMQRMQKEWREADVRRKARLQEAEEEAEDEEEGTGGGRVTTGVMRGGKGKRKGKRRKNKGGGEGSDENGDDGEDPWAVVAANRRREQEEREKGEGKGGLVGLHNVVLAPPKFAKVPMKKVDVADLVRKGGLKKQVELSEARASVIEGYRRMMKERREGAVISAA
ncbi:MAG: hypothetical protein LQ337_005277 [Flavoplaca oasis]|nr:MAG: hypothetical protein LQ337_005277 [Flavoplaca oasis]